MPLLGLSLNMPLHWACPSTRPYWVYSSTCPYSLNLSLNTPLQGLSLNTPLLDLSLNTPLLGLSLNTHPYQQVPRRHDFKKLPATPLISYFFNTTIFHQFLLPWAYYKFNDINKISIDYIKKQLTFVCQATHELSHTQRPGAKLPLSDVPHAATPQLKQNAVGLRSCMNFLSLEVELGLKSPCSTYV